MSSFRASKNHPPPKLRERRLFPVEKLKRLVVRLFLAFEILVIFGMIFWLRSGGLLLW